MVLAGSIGLVVVISVLARQPWFDGAINIGYRSICAVMVKAAIADHVLPETCVGGPPSNFAKMGLIPYTAGILAAAATSALVCVAHRTSDLATWAATLDQAFKATAFVLVASTVAMMLFYHLPLSVVEDKDTQKLLSGFAQGMTLFWGIVFSLTLFAVFGPAQVMLQSAIGRGGETDQDLLKQIEDRSTYRQVKQVLTTLAPLLVGSSAGVIDMLTGAFGG